jgi:hypothetical protein
MAEKTWLSLQSISRLVSNSSVTIARLTIFKTLTSGTSAELTLITSYIINGNACQTALAPDETWKEAEFNLFWLKELRFKNDVRKSTVSNNGLHHHAFEMFF